MQVGDRAAFPELALEELGVFSAGAVLPAFSRVAVLEGQDIAAGAVIADLPLFFGHAVMEAEAVLLAPRLDGFDDLPKSERVIGGTVVLGQIEHSVGLFERLGQVRMPGEEKTVSRQVQR